MNTGCGVCCICGEEYSVEDIKKVNIKGKEKDICKGCATAIKGLV
jgi:hypothetical protein